MSGHALSRWLPEAKEFRNLGESPQPATRRAATRSWFPPGIRVSCAGLLDQDSSASALRVALRKNLHLFLSK